jgi:hypothetical protein
MFEVPESDIIRVRVSEDVILGKKPIEFIRSTNTETSKNSAAATTTDSNESIEVENELKSKAKTYA